MVSFASAEDPAGRVRLPRVEGDHSPRHVHVYEDSHLVVKWNLEAWLPMNGRATAKVLRLIRELENEGAL